MDTTERVSVREAVDGDLPAVQAIYAHHVLTGLASFEEAAPDLGEMRRRRDEVLSRGLPYLVAESRGRVVGYAYATPFRGRPAYRYTVENSVYIERGWSGRGVGYRLMAELIRRCEQSGYRQMIAVIGDSGNAASIALHRKLGFEPAGVLRSVGFKLGRWVDTVYMRRALGSGDVELPARGA